MILCVRREACGASEGAGLELLIRQLQGHPGVEHGGPQLAPHPVVGQAEDLGGKLSGSLGGQDGGAAQTCREKTEAHSGWRIHVERSGGGSVRSALTARHAEGGPDILCPPVRSERRAVDDGVGRVSRHHRTQAVASASHGHKNGGHAVT